MLKMTLMRAGMAALFLASFIAGQAQTDPTKTVATVNGETIGGMDYFRRMEFLPGVGRMSGNRFVETYPGYLALQQLINERLMLQLATEKGVLPKDADIKAELKQRIEANPKLLETLQTVGIGTLDLEYQIRVDLAEFNLITQGVTITDQEIEKHYKDNPSRFTTPKRYKLRLIAVDEAKKASVDAELKAGKKFDEVAKALSQDPSAEVGGLLGELPENAFSDLVRVNLERTKVGQHTAWVQGASGWFMFLVEDIKPAEKRPLDAALRKELRRSLMIDRGSVRNNIEAMMIKQRQKAKVTVSSPGLDPMIQKWLQLGIPDA